MTIIDYRGRKALLITTDELIKMDNNPVFNAAVKSLIDNAQDHDIVAIMVATAMIKPGLPKWLRDYLDHEIRCYRGFIPSCSEPTTEVEK